jgi:all-trans-retinol 13,14-reductase
MKTLGLIFVDFIPLVVALLLQPRWLGCMVALILAASILVRQLQRKKVKTLTVINTVYFLFATCIVLWFPQIPILEYGQVTTYFILSISTIFSLVVGQPFTLQYAKETTPPAVWSHPLFLSINRLLSEIWAVLFSISAVFAVLTVKGWIPLIPGIIATNIWSVFGVVFNHIIPNYMQKKYMANMQKPEAPELAWEPFIAPQAPAMLNHYDVIIIGSGVGGLTAAVELAGVGAKVLVLEQHYLLGGACTTYTRRGGFSFEAGVESISGLGEAGPVRHLLQRHGLENELTWLRNTYEYRHADHSTIIPHDFMGWRDLLAEQFPEEKEGIHNLFAELQACFEEMYTVFAPDRLAPRLPQTMEEMNAYAQNNPHYMRWMDKKWRELLDAFVVNPLLRKQVSLLTGYVGGEGENTSANQMIALMGYFIIGGFRPVGGSGELAKKLVEKIKQYGGDVRISTEVQSIITENNEVIGVQTDKAAYYASIVISNADPRVTYEKLIGLNKLPETYREKVKKLEPSISLFVWNAAVDAEFCTDRLIHYMLSEPIQLSTLGDTITKAGIYSASSLDSSLAPVGKSTVTINLLTTAQASVYKSMSEGEYQAVKKEIDEACRSILAQIDPKAAENIRFTEVATPKTVERYMRTYEGSIYSVKSSDGFPEAKTPIKGLYLAGAGVGYGPGIEAVVISGGEVAERLTPYFKARKEAQHTA